MNILCNICSEYITDDAELMITICGHCFHKDCINSWIVNSKTCPSCRHAISSQSSLIKVFVENDQLRVQDLHNDLIKSNEALSKELKEIKEKARKQEAELIETTAKYREHNETIKNLEREKQLEAVKLTSLQQLYKDATDDIIKLKGKLNTLKLDLLAEKELRRIHQNALHHLDPKNENYDTKNILTEDEELKSVNFSVTPFWQLNSDNRKNETHNNNNKKKDHPYIVPSKIQKANDKPVVLSTQSKFTFRTKRSTDRESHDMPSTSARSVFSLSQDNTQNAQSSSTSNQATFPSFNFGSPSSFSSLFRFGNNSSSEVPMNSENTQQATTNPHMKSYRDNHQPDFDSPRPSER